MLLLLRWLKRLLGLVDLAAITVVMYPLSLLPWRGRHPVMWLFHAWCRAFVRALDVDLRLHEKNLRPLPQVFLVLIRKITRAQLRSDCRLAPPESQTADV